MILEVQNLSKHFEVKSLFRKIGEVKALDNVSIALKSRETLAIVGESGSGKSTLAKCLMQIELPTSGTITLQGKPLSDIPKMEYRRLIQMIFQDPYSSLNPRKKAWQIISEPLQIMFSLDRQGCREAAAQMMTKVGLRSEQLDRYPHMFSGGQRQRLGIARALILKPKILICDEPISALDVSIQAQVLNLLMDLQDEFHLTYLFISHDLSVVRHLADRVVVMQSGKVVETGSRDEVFTEPKHTYTQALLGSTLGVRSPL